MFDMIGEAPVCVRAGWEVHNSISKCLVLADNPHRTSEPTEVIYKIFFSDSWEEKIGDKSA